MLHREKWQWREMKRPSGLTNDTYHWNMSGVLWFASSGKRPAAVTPYCVPFFSCRRGLISSKRTSLADVTVGFSSVSSYYAWIPRQISSTWPWSLTFFWKRYHHLHSLGFILEHNFFLVQYSIRLSSKEHQNALFIHSCCSHRWRGYGPRVRIFRRCRSASRGGWWLSCCRIDGLLDGRNHHHRLRLDGEGLPTSLTYVGSGHRDPLSIRARVSSGPLDVVSNTGSEQLGNTRRAPS